MSEDAPLVVISKLFAEKCEHCGHVPPDHRDDCRISFACAREIAAIRQRFMALSRLPPSPSLAPVAIVLHCPECRGRHVDEGEWATRVHHTHSCQSCGLMWRPAVVATVGVRFLPGFKTPDVRERARGSWEGWTLEEIQKEIAEWREDLVKKASAP